MQKCSLVLASLLFASLLSGDDFEDALDGFDESVTQEESGFEADLEGFDDENVPTDETSSELPSWYSLSGSLGFLTAYNYAQNSASAYVPPDKPMDFSGLSRARTKLNLALDMRHSENWKSRIEVMGWYDASWAIHGRSHYTDEVLDSYESFADIKDAYIQGTLSDSVDLKIGRQIVIWGKSDSIRITDIINPLDIREPGMVDIEDLRLTETMTKLDYYFGDYGLSAMVIHESRLPIEAAFGSDYRPRDTFGTTAPDSIFPDVKEIGWELDNTQFAVALDGRYEGWDLSWYGANVLNNAQFGIEAQSDGSKLRTFDKIYMLGMATNVVQGSWLYKAEVAYLMDINYRSVEDNKDRLDALVGIDYSGFSKTVLSIELADRHIFGYEAIMLENTLLPSSPQKVFPDFTREDSVIVALRGNYTFDNDNAVLNYVLNMSGSSSFSFEDGGFQRLWMDYKYNDSVSFSGGIVDYIGGDGVIPFYNAISNNDRLFAEVVYSF